MRINFKRSLMVAIALHALLLISIVTYSSHLARISPVSEVGGVQVSLVAETPAEAPEAPATAAKLIAAATPPTPPPMVIKPVSTPTPVTAPPPRSAVDLVAAAIPIPLTITPEPVVRAVNTAQAASTLPESVSEGSSVNPASGSTADSGNNGSQLTTAKASNGIITQLMPREGKSPAPVYPSVARRMRHEGVVVLQVRVNQLGKPMNVELKQSSGFAELDAAAMQTVRRKWEFEPKMVNGVPVEGEAEQSVQFTLKK